MAIKNFQTENKKDILRLRFFVFLSIFLFICCKIGYELLISYDQEDAYSHKAASEAANALETLFLENTSLLRYIGETIQGVPEKERLNHIENYLLLTAELSLKSLTTSYISWANPEGYILVSGKAGITKDSKKNIRKRSYFSSLKIQPWKLLFAEPEKSLFSAKYVLPTAMSVTNRKGDIIGSLILGLRVDEIYKVMNAFISRKGYTAFLYDSSHGLYVPTYNTDSLTIEKKRAKNSYKQKLKGYNNFEIHAEKDPFVVFLNSMNEQRYDFLILISICIIFFSLLEMIIRNNSKLSEKIVFLRKSKSFSEISLRQREAYYRESFDRFDKNIDDLETCIGLVSELVHDKQTLPLIQRSKDLARSLRNLKIDRTRNKSFSFNCVIDDAIAYYTNEIYEENINVVFQYMKDIPLAIGDEFHLKHVLINIFGKLLESAYGIRTICLKTASKNIQRDHFTLMMEISFMEGKGFFHKNLEDEITSFSSRSIHIQTEKKRNKFLVSVSFDSHYDDSMKDDFKKIVQKNKQGLYLVYPMKNNKKDPNFSS